ncbi:30S ribosomal protein S16 [Caldichromatium japonicum]|uniref:Small ribosomal subunit protein bS16 n=1 Tax=Caldichromatium japonicum TaxID=2699430 RepID=A0A6G7VCB8_9GAMM|nr:30S ribosomal protein S16 [Caldichromatium japonicum]QIK37661.1 30S ribosomal protein S16 [Caldichromatium japonicum]
MVKIRLSRGGSKKNPFYHIVVADIRCKRDGRYIERLGFYNPNARGGEVPLRLDTERAQHWIQQGAQPTERVRQLLKQARREAATV